MKFRNNAKLMVLFQPQAWVSDKAIPVGPAEPADVTRGLLELNLQEVQSMEYDPDAHLNLMDGESRGHWGPYHLEYLPQMRAFFGVTSLSEVTQEMLDVCKAVVDPDAPRALEDRTHLIKQWMVIYGEDRLAFACMAEGASHAIEQCENANPHEPVVAAFDIAAVAADQSGALTGQMDQTALPQQPVTPSHVHPELARKFIEACDPLHEFA